MLNNSAANWRRSHAFPSQLPPVTMPKPGSVTPPDAPTVQGSPPTIDGGMISGVFRRVCVLVKLVPVTELPLVAAALLAAASVPVVDVPDVVLLLIMTPLVELLWPLLAAALERLLLLLLPLADELLDDAPLPIGLP
jgi:hypothetical protein